MTNEWTEADIAALELKNADVKAEYQTGKDKIGRMDDAWTQTEVDFADEFLEQRLETGQSLAWWPQVKFRLPFMTYTADFAELSAGGNINIFEVKGSYRLGSAGRSNTAVRALNHFIGLSYVRVIRATKKDNGDWKIETIRDRIEKGPHTRAKVKPAPGETE